MAVDQFDVVIVGAGPAGLMAAVWMAQTNIEVLLVEKKACRTLVGHADGLESRSFEILDSFGIGQGMSMESNKTVEVCLWNPSGSGIRRSNVSVNHNPGLSRFQEATLGQGRIEEHLLNFLKPHEHVKIAWGTAPSSLYITTDKPDTFTSHPIEVRLKPNPGANIKVMSNDMTIGPLSKYEKTNRQPSERIVRAKYLIGCDGAHSWVRKQLDLSLEGETSEQNWGVLDCIPVTDFPDIRKRCIIKSDAGNLMVIPREQKLVRFYVQISDSVSAKSKTNYHPSTLVTALKEILRPYVFDTSHIEWSTMYNVGQRLCKTLSVGNRIFLAGDSIHTHSPKVGQGMNVSMQDTYNLGWKLAHVLKGVAVSDILDTYQEERFPVAERLISFDRRMCLEICSTNVEDRSDSLKAALSEENTSASGLGVKYGPSLLITPLVNRDFELCREIHNGVSPYSKTQLAQNIVVGERFPSVQVLCQSDSHTWHLQQRFSSTGQWHLVVFGGDVRNEVQRTRVERLGTVLSHPASFLARINRNARDSLVGTVAVYLVHCSSRREVEFMDLPEIFRPFDKENGYEYGRVFADNEDYQGGGGNASRFYGISPQGCLVLLRPDQHVAFIGDLEDTRSLETFFARFSVLAKPCDH